MSWGGLQQAWQVTILQEVCADLVGLGHTLQAVMPGRFYSLCFVAIRWV